MQADKEPSSTGMTWALAIILAIIVGGFEENAAGFLVGALLGVLLAQVLHLRSLLKLQNERIKQLRFEHRAPAAPPAAAATPAQPPTPQAPIFDKAPAAIPVASQV